MIGSRRSASRLQSGTGRAGPRGWRAPKARRFHGFVDWPSVVGRRRALLSRGSGEPHQKCAQSRLQRRSRRAFAKPAVGGVDLSLCVEGPSLRALQLGKHGLRTPPRVRGCGVCADELAGLGKGLLATGGHAAFLRSMRVRPVSRRPKRIVQPRRWHKGCEPRRTGTDGPAGEAHMAKYDPLEAHLRRQKSATYEMTFGCWPPCCRVARICRHGGETRRRPPPASAMSSLAQSGLSRLPAERGTRAVRAHSALNGGRGTTGFGSAPRPQIRHNEVGRCS